MLDSMASYFGFSHFFPSRQLVLRPGRDIAAYQSTNRMGLHLGCALATASCGGRKCSTEGNIRSGITSIQPRSGLISLPNRMAMRNNSVELAFLAKKTHCISACPSSRRKDITGSYKIGRQSEAHWKDQRARYKYPTASRGGKGRSSARHAPRSR